MLVSRTPMLIFPNGLDGGGNAARVAFHGLGKLAAFADHSETIEANLKDLLFEMSFKDAVCGVADQIADLEDAPETFLTGLFEPDNRLSKP